MSKILMFLVLVLSANFVFADAKSEIIPLIKRARCGMVQEGILMDL